MIKQPYTLNNSYIINKVSKGRDYNSLLIFNSLKLNNKGFNLVYFNTLSNKKKFTNFKINFKHCSWRKVSSNYKKKVYSYFPHRRLYFSNAWRTYLRDWKLNFNNKKSKFSRNWRRSPLSGYYYFSYIYSYTSLVKISYNESSIYLIEVFQKLLNYLFTLQKSRVTQTLFIKLKFFIINKKFNYTITKYNLINKMFSVIKLTANQSNPTNKFTINKYQSILIIFKKISNTKIKIFLNRNNNIELKYNNYNYNLLYYFFIKKFKFMWRYLLIVNLIKLYIYLLTTNNLNKTASLLNHYFKNQLRVLFSKQDQKYFLYLILNFNKIFINSFNNYKYNICNNLNSFKIIITGRWQRKRWVTPFPKTYRAGLVKYNILFKKYDKSNYILSYDQKTIFTKKGDIGLRLFLMFKL